MSLNTKNKLILRNLFNADDLKYIFIDVDHTLINGNTGRIFSYYLYKKKLLRLKDIYKIPYHSILYLLGILDYSHILQSSIRAWGNKKVSLLIQEGEECYQNKIKPLIYPEALALLHDLKSIQKNIYLISASPKELLCHLDRDLGLPVLCTELNVINDQFTGKLNGPFCYGKGKLENIRNIIGNAPFAAISDSINDLPMLEHAKSKVVINPDFRLKQLAIKRNWPIFKFQL